MNFKVKKIYRCLLLINFIFTTVYGGEPFTLGANDCSLYHENGVKVSNIEWKRGIVLPPILDTTGKNKHLITMKTDGLSVKLNGIFVNKKVLDFDKFYIDKTESMVKFNLQTWDFYKYEEYETQENMTIRVVFDCKIQGTKEITFKQPIIDTNNHDPVFLKESYDYTLAMPLTKGFELSPHDPITVKDIDLTNDKITFDLKNQPKGFSISFIGKDPLNPKHHLAKLEVTDTVYLTDDVSFTVYATDSGNPPRSTNTTINIKIDASNSLPRFSRSLYTADVTFFNDHNISRLPLEFTPGQIELTQGYAGVDTFEIDGIDEDYKKHFKISETNETCGIGKCIQVDLVNLPANFWDNQQDFFVFLKAIKASFEASTVLYIQAPRFRKIKNIKKRSLTGHTCTNCTATKFKLFNKFIRNNFEEF